MILFRTHVFDRHAQAFYRKLRSESGFKVVLLLDESNTKMEMDGIEKISITREAIAKLKLHCPAGFQWRCGDYGLYLAQEAYPNTKHFWLVEYDVRIHTENSLDTFFKAFDSDPADLIAPYFCERTADWWWFASMASNRKPVYGCLFPMVRISSKAIKVGLIERRLLSKRMLYRLFWPNDEAFIASVAWRGGLICRDLNDRQKQYYTSQTFSFENALSGEALSRSAPDGLIYHPVLYGAAYQAKRNKIVKPTSLGDRLRWKARLSLKGWA